MRKIISLSICMILVLVIHANAQIYLSGSLSGVLAENVYLVISNISVESGDSLIIQPGAVFIFGEDFDFDIYGYISAAGAEDDSIKFINSPGLTWGGISFNTTADSNKFEYCRISGSSSNYGIFCYPPSIIIINRCLVSGNNGWGIGCNYSSSPIITNCNISGNTGGGICGVNSCYLISNCTISGNTSSEGGGILLQGSTNSTISNCIISGNTTTGNGGGISSINSSTSISNCTIIGNTALIGGGIHLSGPYPSTISYCIISGNSDEGSGGGIHCSSPNSIISNCIINGNITEASGGGIYCGSTNLTISNCTISNNTATYVGGGIHCLDNSSLDILNSVVESNYGSYGVFFYNPSNCSITYCDFFNNQNGNFYNPPQWAGMIVTTNPNGDPCDIYHNIFLDPLFVTGPWGDYYLSQPEGGQSVTSPCVNAGDAPIPPNSGSTCTNQGYDLGIIDIGYHYPHIQDYPLPVEMVLFTAAGSDAKVLLHWVTASELNNDHFCLYRSPLTPDNFQKLAGVPGNGTTSIEHQYYFEDNQVTNGLTYYYRISSVDINGTEEFYGATVSAIPGGGENLTVDSYDLQPNFPNPFNADTRLDYTIASAGMVKLTVYDISGKEIAVLANQYQPNGPYSVIFSAENLPSGIYFAKLTVNGYQAVRKMALVK